MTPLTVILPVLPPSVNHMYAPNRRGGRRLTDEAQSFRDSAIVEIRTTANVTGWRVPSGALRFTLLLTFADKKRADIDNRVKAALDSLALALDFDDARIDEIVVRRVGIDPKRPLCEMILEALS